MLLPALKVIYDDAMLLQRIYELEEHATYVEISPFIRKWEKLSSDISVLIPRVAEKDVDCGKSLMQALGYCLDEKDDFRELIRRISEALIPEMKKALKKLYAPIRLGNDKWLFEKTDSGFIGVKDKENGKYLHNPADPLREAVKLAEKLYDPMMDSFHILGSGLGYLAYAIWEQSERSAHLYIYENDSEMLQYADQCGVLSWIDSDCLTIVDSSNINNMLKLFLSQMESGIGNTYISDWKVGFYDDYEYGKLIDQYDFNERTARINEKTWKINIRENYKLSDKSVEDFKAISRYSGKEFVVVSAGPSLDDNIEFLKTCSGEKVLIAINASLKRLVKEEVLPDITVILDPLPSLANHIEGIEDRFDKIPLIMPINASHTFAGKYSGIKYMISDYDKTTDGFEWNFGGTVASLGIDLAYYLGATAIYLVGSDLAFSQGKNYAGNVSHSVNEGINNSISVVSNDGGMVQTNNLYNSYREMIELQISKHSGVPVYNMAAHGAMIKGTIINKK